MKQPMVPILLLATVALSTSNIIPLLSTDTDKEPLSFERQTNDNTLRNRFDNRNFFNIFCKDTVFRQSDLPTPCKYFRLNNYIREMNMEPIRNHDNAMTKDDNHNGEGYRKAQWHNYPRQLDRLQNQPYDRHKVNYIKRKSGLDDTESENSQFKKSDDFNEYLLASNDASSTIYDSYVTSSSPLLILRIRLACLNDKLASRSFNETPEYWYGFENANKQDVNAEEEKNPNFNPAVEIMELKRSGPADIDNEYSEIDSPSITMERLPVKKRIFSLWSRLQTLGPTGHQLHHRRHLHAFYGLPEDLGADGTLTAETRAALMRPPGSPLRWG